jgi:hypothetical protein
MHLWSERYVRLSHPPVTAVPAIYNSVGFDGTAPLFCSKGYKIVGGQTDSDVFLPADDCKYARNVARLVK